MATVAQILRTKGNGIRSVSPNAMVIEALRIMAEKNIGAIVVMENEKVVGIFSERDYARKIVLKNKESHTTAIREIMTHKVVFVTPTTSVDECMELMTEKGIRHLPVVENEKLTGIISISDVVKFIIEEQKDTIKNLESYISG